MTTAEKKLVRQRLSVLQLAEVLGNVAEACRRRGMCRSQFYEFKRRFQTHGIEGLKDLPPIHKTHPQTTPKEVVDKILEMAEKEPMWGCVRISSQLKLIGVTVSSPTVQKILNQNGLGSKYQRLLKLEEKALSEGVQLTPVQVAAIEKANPCFRERHIESSKPGELLCQDTFYVGALKGVGKVYMQAVVDTYGSYAFGYLHSGKIPEQAVAVLYNDVLPQYEEWGLPVSSILTDNGSEYCGTPNHRYELFLELNDIKHKKTKVKSPRTNGFVERFNRTVLDEFFRNAFRKNFYESIDALQKDLDIWLKHYNYERPHQGYRNLGKRPIDTINLFIQNVQKEG
ncbi:MAG: IS481 family transposase [Acidobacteria bacterium]|nr:IS481 family transposase [Acidobacteriota bacterium]